MGGVGGGGREWWVEGVEVVEGLVGVEGVEGVGWVEWVEGVEEVVEVERAGGVGVERYTATILSQGSGRY